MLVAGDSGDQFASVCYDDLPSHIGARIGRQKQSHPGNILRRPYSTKRRAIFDLLQPFRIFPQFPRELRLDEAGRYGINSNTARTPLNRQIAGQLDQRSLGNPIGTRP